MCVANPYSARLSSRSAWSCDSGLRGRNARDRQAERRAADVVEAGVVEEADRTGISPVLAADAQLQIRAHAAAALGRDPHELADPVLIDRLKRGAVDDLLLDV